MSGTRRRHHRLAALTAALVVGAAGCSATPAAHGHPDPGGHKLAVLKTVEHAVPPNAQVMQRQAYEPRWDSCDGRPRTFGWSDVTVDVEFGSGVPPRTLIADADRASGCWCSVPRLWTVVREPN